MMAVLLCLRVHGSLCVVMVKSWKRERKDSRPAPLAAPHKLRTAYSCDPTSFTTSYNICTPAIATRHDQAIRMSAEATPISAARFASALTDLPISSLYAKHVELTNNIAHLESSNKQLEDFARENDDRDCYEALLENRQVMKNFKERMDLIRKEVEEIRGLPWRPRDEGEVRKEEGATGLNGTAPTQNGTSAPSSHGLQSTQEQATGTSTQTGEEEEGVYL